MPIIRALAHGESLQRRPGCCRLGVKTRGTRLRLSVCLFGTARWLTAWLRVRAVSGKQQDLRDSADREEMRRTVAAAAGPGLPARIAGGEVVRDEPVGRGNDDDIAN